MPFSWNDLQFFWRKPEATPAGMSSTTPTPDTTEASSSSSSTSSSSTGAFVAPPGYMDCPVERDVLGRHSWTLLHTIAATIPDKPSQQEQKELNQFVTALSNFYPCNWCARDFQNLLKEDPPRVETRQDFAQWMCEVHNAVNERLGKPAFDCSKVDERWRDGWKDGRCD